MKEIKSCGIVIYRNVDQPLFLLLEYASDDHWGFPKGGVEEGEEEKQTALRELKEETGISEVDLIPGFKEILRYKYKAGGVEYDKTVVFFLGEAKQDGVNLSSEHKGHKWLNFQDALQQITYDEEKDLLKKASHHMKHHNKSLSDFF